MFVFLLILGCTNVWLLKKQAKFRKPIFAFYASSLTVIFFRVLLFMDQWIDYPTNIYVILLVSMPTYLFLIVGMSQVMLSVECILKYKNFETKESEVLSYVKKKEITERNNKLLSWIYIGIFIFSLGVIIGFSIYQIAYATKGDTQDKTYVSELPLAILNLIVWGFLLWSTCSFVRLINRRFGKDFKNAKLKLFSVLTVFSFSFLIRATWDLYIRFNLNMDFKS